MDSDTASQQFGEEITEIAIEIAHTYQAKLLGSSSKMQKAYLVDRETGPTLVPAWLLTMDEMESKIAELAEQVRVSEKHVSDLVIYKESLSGEEGEGAA